MYERNLVSLSEFRVYSFSRVPTHANSARAAWRAVEVWEVVVAEEAEGEAEGVQIAVETVEVVEVMEPDGVVDEGGRSTGRSEKRRSNM